MMTDDPAVATPGVLETMPPRRWPKRLLGTALVVLSLLALGHIGWQLAKFRQTHMVYMGLFNKAMAPLFGDPVAATEAARWKPLWDGHPDDAAYFAQYVLGYFSDHTAVSDELLESARKIDPDNGLYLTLAASGLAKEAVVSKPRTGRRDPASKAKALEWEIRDDKLMDQALDLTEQALALPRFEDYQSRLLAERLRVFPPRKDQVSGIARIVHVAVGSPPPNLSLVNLGKLLSAAGQRCKDRHDVAGLQRIIRLWHRLSYTAATRAQTLLEVLVARTVFVSPMANFRDAAQELGLQEAADQFEAIRAAEQDRREAMKHRSWDDELLESRSSVFAGLALPTIGNQLDKPPQIAEADVRPGRYADHALFGQVSALVAWFLFGLFASAAVVLRKRQSPDIRDAAVELVRRLEVRDQVWILLGGILAPLVFFLAITRLTPLSAREWSLISLGLYQAFGQFLAWLLLTLVATLAITRWRLAKHEPSLLAASRLRWLPAASCVLTVMALLWCGRNADLTSIKVGEGIFQIDLPLGLDTDQGRAMVGVGVALIALQLVWLLAEHAWLLRRNGSVLRAATFRCLPTAWLCGMLLSAALVLVNYAEERYWVQRDALMEVTPQFTRFEGEVSRILRQDLLEQIAAARNAL